MTRSPILTVLLVALATLGFTPIASAHYDPVQGRWLERDPSVTSSRLGGSIQRHPDGANLYEYSRSAPANRRDPMGLASSSDADRAARKKAVECDTGCCEVRVYATSAFGLPGVYHLCLEIETPVRPGEQPDASPGERPEFDSDSTCVTHRAELERWWEDYNNDGDWKDDPGEIAPWWGPVGIPFGESSGS
jgi:hypothetical protein